VNIAGRTDEKIRLAAHIEVKQEDCGLDREASAREDTTRPDQNVAAPPGPSSLGSTVPASALRLGEQGPATRKSDRTSSTMTLGGISMGD
jgi:hypothetical protein